MFKYQILATQVVSAQQFIDYWSSHYDYKKDQLYKYSDHIEKREFSATDIHALFEWKNGMPLSGNKKKTVASVRRNLRTVNSLKKRYDDELFQRKFGKISLVWRIFLQHIINPRQFPLYDQHIHRAYTYLTTGKVAQEKNTVSEKLDFYKNKYISFYNDLCRESGLRNKEILDDALWSFGKFLSRYPKMIVQ